MHLHVNKKRMRIIQNEHLYSHMLVLLTLLLRGLTLVSHIKAEIRRVRDSLLLINSLCAKACLRLIANASQTLEKSLHYQYSRITCQI